MKKNLKNRKTPPHRKTKLGEDIFEIYKGRELPFVGENKIPFHGTIDDILEMGFFLQDKFEQVNKLDVPLIRYIVLETWLAIDYAVRHLLCSLLQFNRFRTDDFEPFYKLCPQSYNDCVNILEKLVNEQEKLPDIKSLDEYEEEARSEFFWLNADEVFDTGEQTLDECFLSFFHSFMKLHYPEVNLSKLIEEDLDDPIHPLHKEVCVNQEWLTPAKKFLENKKKFKQLNKARNKVAHSMDENQIFKELGINGTNLQHKRKKAKDICLALLHSLRAGEKCINF
ncbi:MAG: hypothetical protein PVG30_09495 [Gammaproteobacteria bacterium]|jgi:hypothetical protein